jgi:predicted transcriptional regulator
VRERSQEELARALEVGQPAVAKLERRTDMYVSNLRHRGEIGVALARKKRSKSLACNPS